MNRVASRPFAYVAGIVVFGALAVAPSPARAQTAGRNLGSLLQPGVAIRPGDYMVSPQAKYFAVLQADKNLIIYEGASPTTGTGKVIWSTDTWRSGAGPSFAILQGDGNFVLYSGAEGAPTGVLWAAASNSGGASILTMDDSGALAVCSGSSVANVTSMRWSSGGRSHSYWLSAGEFLKKGDYMVSANKLWSAVLRQDGNFVILNGYYPYNGGSMMRWESGTTGHTEAVYASHQPDGNFVIYQGTGPNDMRGTVWAAGSTGGNGTSVLVLDNEGYLRAYTSTSSTPTGTPRWSVPSSNTFTPVAPLNGVVVALKAPSGRWLVSQPNGTLGYSATRTRDSEFYLFRPNPDLPGYLLESYPGFMMMSSSGTPITAPLVPYAAFPTATLLRAYDSSGLSIPTPADGGQIILGLDSGKVLIEGTTGPTQVAYDSTLSPTDARTRYGAWTIVTVNPVTAGRSQSPNFAYQQQPASGTFYALQTSHNTTFQMRTAAAEMAIHTTTKSGRGLAVLAPPGTLLTWGMEATIQSSSFALKEGAPENGLPTLEWAAPTVPATKWRMIDPTGQAIAGSRIPNGAQFCLQNVATGKLIGANPSAPKLYLTPNTCSPTGTWELWRITSP